MAVPWSRGRQANLIWPGKSKCKGKMIADGSACRYQNSNKASNSQFHLGVCLMTLRGFTLTAIFALVAALLSAFPARALNIVAIGASNTSGLGAGAQKAHPAL